MKRRKIFEEVKATRLDVFLVMKEWEPSQFHGNALSPAGTMKRMIVPLARIIW